MKNRHAFNRLQSWRNVPYRCLAEDIRSFDISVISRAHREQAGECGRGQSGERFSVDLRTELQTDGACRQSHSLDEWLFYSYRSSSYARARSSWAVSVPRGQSEFSSDHCAYDVME